MAGGHIEFIEFPFVGFRYFLMASVFIILIFTWKRWHFWGYRQTIGRFEWLGSISYALYVFHYPLICDFRFFPGKENFVFWADLCLRILTAFILAWLVEIYLQKWINLSTDSWLDPGRKKNQTERPLAIAR